MGGSEATVPEEYLSYVGGASNSQIPFRGEPLREFKESLGALSMCSNDVEGISKLARSAHLEQIVGAGSYRGLFQEESAIEVGTTVHEILNALENMRRRGELGDDTSVVDAELRRRGLLTSGIKDAIFSAWNTRLKAEVSYSELFEERSRDLRKSDLTTNEAFKLYSSFFATEQRVSEVEGIYLFGARPPEAGAVGQSSLEKFHESSSFASKAVRVGFQVSSHRGEKPAPLFSNDQKQSVPAGFEMINEDMFARKANKFMVFNRPGVASWSGTDPKTKVTGIESMLMGTL